MDKTDRRSWSTGRKFFTAGLVVMLLSCLAVAMLMRQAQERLDAWLDSATAPAASAALPSAAEKTIGRAELEAQVENCLQRLQAADADLRQQCLEQISAALLSRRKHASAFAEAALSPGTLWELLKARLDDPSGQSGAAVLARVFAEQVVSAAEAESMVKQACGDYLSGAVALEAGVIKSLRGNPAALPKCPSLTVPVTQVLELGAKSQLADSAQLVLENSAVSLARECGSLALGGVASSAALRLATFAVARLGASAAAWGVRLTSGWATLGIGLLAAYEADALLTSVLDRYYRPQEELVRQAADALDKLRNTLLYGESGTSGLAGMWRNHALERQILRRRLLQQCLGLQ